jgi:hypothetical protein
VPFGWPCLVFGEANCNFCGTGSCEAAAPLPRTSLGGQPLDPSSPQVPPPASASFSSGQVNTNFEAVGCLPLQWRSRSEAEITRRNECCLAFARLFACSHHSYSCAQGDFGAAAGAEEAVEAEASDYDDEGDDTEDWGRRDDSHTVPDWFVPCGGHCYNL